MSNRMLAAIGAVVLLFGSAYILSPLWAMHQFKQAALSADVDRIDAAVDFPAVRESLKSQITVAFTAKIANDPEMRENPFSGIGLALMPPLIDKMVDGFVTAEGISAMMKQGRANASSDQINPDITYDYGYNSLNRFTVSVKYPDDRSDEPPKFVFERRGIFSWKLIRLQIPPTMFDDKQS